jgi:hypothetical protein
MARSQSTPFTYTVSASRDETLRKAAQQRFKGTGQLTAED